LVLDVEGDAKILHIVRNLHLKWLSLVLQRNQNVLHSHTVGPRLLPLPSLHWFLVLEQHVGHHVLVGLVVDADTAPEVVIRHFVCFRIDVHLVFRKLLLGLSVFDCTVFPFSLGLALEAIIFLVIIFHDFIV
jgi:hypothetical protein